MTTRSSFSGEDSSRKEYEENLSAVASDLRALHDKYKVLFSGSQSVSNATQAQTMRLLDQVLAMGAGRFDTIATTEFASTKGWVFK